MINFSFKRKLQNFSPKLKTLFNYFEKYSVGIFYVLLFLHSNPCTCLGKCSSTFLVVPRRDLRPSPFFGGATPQSEAVLGLSSIQIREYDHQKSDLYLCSLWISSDYLREIGWQ